MGSQVKHPIGPDLGNEAIKRCSIEHVNLMNLDMRFDLLDTPLLVSMPHQEMHLMAIREQATGEIGPDKPRGTR